jgi:nucleotide-binding universal stress UspA family protein
MTISAILVQTNIDDFPGGRVKVAADLAGRFGATLIGVCACALQPILTDAMAVGVAGIIEDPSDIEAQLQTAQTKFRELAGQTAKLIEWRSSIDFPTDHAARQARAADLVVSGPSRRRSLYREVDPAELILLAGRPVLAVPADVSHLAADRVVVGWKDTREARRAVLDALPLLERASEVTVAVVAEKSDSAAFHSAADVVGYLRRHQVKAADVLVEADGSAGDRLIALAKERGADLIVAGAYGHSRVREWIFGGVTRDLLTKSPICCLMAN